MAVLALIPAAGRGKRMGADVSKQFLELAGRPILAHTLDLFQASPLVDAIILVVPPHEQAACRRQVLAGGNYDKLRPLVDGGAERQDSVRNGLRAAGAASDDIVLIHDGVRPLLDPRSLPALVEVARTGNGAVLGVPVKDTVKQVRDGHIEGTPPRESLWLAQTPQAFPFGLIAEAHERAFAESFTGTDDASLVERLGRTVSMVRGDYRNLKITTPEDLLVAEALLRKGEEQT